jgi:GMP synthase (glutamine-hydrolysing)
LRQDLRLLVVDAYPASGRRALTNAGGTEGGTLYRRMLEKMQPDATIEVTHPADATAESDGTWDGAVFTGSNLSILDREAPEVERLVDFAQRLLRTGTPIFGSCFAVQLAAVAGGGRCAANPKGREFGISRKIQLTDAGAEHPLYSGKRHTFDAFTSHADEVAVLAPGTALLASNTWSRVQATCTDDARGSFWAVQYHPEYDCHEVASLCRLRKDELVAQGTFANAVEAERNIELLEQLHGEPGNAEAAAELRAGDSLLDPEIRTREVRNWLDARVLAKHSASPGGQ